MMNPWDWRFKSTTENDFDDTPTETQVKVPTHVECYLCGRKGPRISYSLIRHHGGSVCPQCVEYGV